MQTCSSNKVLKPLYCLSNIFFYLPITCFKEWRKISWDPFQSYQTLGCFAETGWLCLQYFFLYSLENTYKHTKHCTRAEGTTVCKNGGVPAFWGRDVEEKRGQIIPGIRESFLEEVAFGLKSWRVRITCVRPKKESGGYGMGKVSEVGWRQIF